MLMWLAATGSSACTPTFDWREVRPDGSGVVALFPCKPVSHAREVALAGAPIKMTMAACSAGNAVFAVAFADVGEPGRVAPALAELRNSAARNLGISNAVEARPITIDGMTPNVQAGRVTLAGRRPDGTAVQEELAVFARGTTVYQATVLGTAADAGAVETFIAALKVPS